MLPLYWSLIICSLSICCRASGVFEMEILKYEHFNLSRVPTDSFLSVLSLPGYPEPYLVYNLCLKEANARLLSQPCTFGQLSSSPSSLAIPVLMRMPFTFRWMVSVWISLSLPVQLHSIINTIYQLDWLSNFNCKLLFRVVKRPECMLCPKEKTWRILVTWLNKLN